MCGLDAFTVSLAACCKQYGLVWVGGDTCRGPMNVGLTVIGELPGAAMTRCGARPGDDVWVSGFLGRGSAALALQKSEPALQALGQDERDVLLQHFYSPPARVALGRELATMASAAIDISDGLLADAAHIARQSRVQIDLQAASLPVPPELASLSDRRQCMTWLLGGDDYELLFTADSGSRESIADLARRMGIAMTRVGSVSVVRDVDPVVRLMDVSGDQIDDNSYGWQHF